VSGENTYRTSQLAVYVAVIALSVTAIAAVVHLGTRWYPTAAVAPAASVTGPATAPPAGGGPLPRLLAQLPIVVAATQVGGRLARGLGQPGVIGDIAAGVLLGPSLVRALLPARCRRSFRPRASRRCPC
jgi:hypothetical protein